MVCQMSPEPEPPPPEPNYQPAAIIRTVAQELTYSTTFPTTPVEVELEPPTTTLPSTTLQVQHSHRRVDIHEHTHSLPPPTRQNSTTSAILMKTAATLPHCPSRSYLLHIDGGANRSITDDSTLLLQLRHIRPYYMSSASQADSIKCTAMGYLPWQAPNGRTLLVKCYYSAQATDTIISPTDIVLTHRSAFTTWTQKADMNTKQGHITFSGDNAEDVCFPLFENNGLWYYHQDDYKDYIHPHTDIPTIQKVNAGGLYELFHARLGHPGEKVMGQLHKHVDGLPKLKPPPLFRCNTCLLVNATKRPIPSAVPTQTSSTTQHPDKPSTAATQQPGTFFQMDMGFVRGTKYRMKGTDGGIVTSLDGYNSYLIVVDRATRYTWVFLSRYKTPKIDLLRTFLETHGHPTAHMKRIRSDEGGELWGSREFQHMAKEMGFILEPTASDASFQNGIAERPNRTLGNMMRALLHGANLGPQYWSWALLHAVYLKNRLPHQSTLTTPYQAYTGHKPNLKRLRIFGSPVVARLPGRRPAKLDTHAVMGIFLGFTSTEKNIYYQDVTTQKIKIATHVVFDEAGYTTPKKQRSHIQQRLQDHLINPSGEYTDPGNSVDIDKDDVGHNHSNDDAIHSNDDATHTVHNATCRSMHATVTGRDDAISTNIGREDGIKPYDIWLSGDPFEKRLTITIPTMGKHPTLGMLLKQEPYQRVQLIDMERSTPGAKVHKWRSSIKRGSLLQIDNTSIASIDDAKRAIAAAKDKQQDNITCHFATVAYQPLHPTEGSLMLYYDQLNIIAKHLMDIETESTIQKGQSRQVQATQPAKPQSPAPHPTMPPLAHPVGTALNTMTLPPPAPNPCETPTAIADKHTQNQYQIAPEELGSFFTLKQLKTRPDWPLWRQARYQMLDSYLSQGMFGEPTEKPVNANIHHMLWRYLLKMDGTRKARMVCDGSARQGTVTLGHTYANSLDTASERLFWAITAQKGLTAYGADCSNAFAEAPPPVHPLYLQIDEAFRDWWTTHLGRPPIPSTHTVVRVHHAIQGHPESPRLWEKLVDKILRDIGFKPTTHEPCLYSGIIQGQYTLFLRQVDDFAIATNNKHTADYVIQRINEKLQLPIHIMGKVDRFNGVDIAQTKHYIKISCHKYLSKVEQSYPWLQSMPHTSTPLPFPSDKYHLNQILQCAVPSTESEQLALEKRMGIKYRKLMGEILFPMVKCRPDVSSHAILLSQYMNNPGEAHYTALKHLLHYLVLTKDVGIHYWRKSPHPTLPQEPLPQLHLDNYSFTNLAATNSKQLVAFVDSDWATSTKSRNSITGMILMFAGGAVGYKSKFQPVIAHSSTEAEFVAACDTAKMILFFRSLLADVGLAQTDATVLFEDNNGALMMANAQQPTRRTRHMEIKHFALLDWVERDLLILQSIKTQENAADAMTKTLTKQLFYRHLDTYMGNRIPAYCATYDPNAHVQGCSHRHSHAENPTKSSTLRALRRVHSMGGGTGHTYS
jgi:hypothetical protein